MEEFPSDERRQLLEQLRNGEAPVRKEPEKAGYSFFKLRFLLAVVLLLGVIFMDRNQISLGGISSETLYEILQTDYEENLSAWVKDIAEKVSDSSQISIGPQSGVGLLPGKKIKVLLFGFHTQIGAIGGNIAPIT